MRRRDFLWGGSSAILTGWHGSTWAGQKPATTAVNNSADEIREMSLPTPAQSVVPVVGDGKWIWTKPPKDKGYQEPRDFSLSIGMELRGRGPASRVRATTIVPVEHPEQKIKEAKVEAVGCQGVLRQLAPTAGQLLLAANSLVSGQTIRAVAHFRLTLNKDYRGFAPDQFPDQQEYPKDFLKKYMYDSPGIQTRAKQVRDLAKKLAVDADHPWEKAKRFYEWVWENIKAKIQYYTSVTVALRDRVGDCEERAAVFVALCRASGIPARLVWVPGHNWAEFALRDYKGQGHWIPAHTSAYSWFGWTGVHEVVLQKGDSIHVPEKRKSQRLVADWMQWVGKRPLVRYFATLEPIAPESQSDPGPGARRKVEKGEWKAFGPYASKKFNRK